MADYVVKQLFPRPNDDQEMDSKRSEISLAIRMTLYGTLDNSDDLLNMLSYIEAIEKGTLTDQNLEHLLEIARNIPMNL